MKVISNLYKLITFTAALFFIFSGAWILSVLTIGLLIEELSKKYYKKPFWKVLLNIKK